MELRFQASPLVFHLSIIKGATMQTFRGIPIEDSGGIRQSFRKRRRKPWYKRLYWWCWRQLGVY